jgi:hypothetical protein
MSFGQGYRGRSPSLTGICLSPNVQWGVELSVRLSLEWRVHAGVFPPVVCHPGTLGRFPCSESVEASEADNS